MELAPSTETGLRLPSVCSCVTLGECKGMQEGWCSAASSSAPSLPGTGTTIMGSMWHQGALRAIAMNKHGNWGSSPGDESPTRLFDTEVG